MKLIFKVCLSKISIFADFVTLGLTSLLYVMIGCEMKSVTLGLTILLYVTIGCEMKCQSRTNAHNKLIKMMINQFQMQILNAISFLKV